MTKEQLRKEIIEFLRIGLASSNDDNLKTLSRAITNLCANDIIIDPDPEDTASLLDSLCSTISAIAEEIRYQNRL
jgi:CO dehydrogenase/acetyl-CoA synthase gamma subunit (corrinoid Fe-S protein)